LKESLQEEISAIPRSLLAIARDISVTVSDESNVAKKIANFLNGTFAFCLTSPQLVSVGNRFKNSLNENAKVHCINESILEASHNAIVPFAFNKYGGNDDTLFPKILLLTWTNDSALVKGRFDRITSFITEIGHHIFHLHSRFFYDIYGHIKKNRSIFHTGHRYTQGKIVSMLRKTISLLRR
jgi:Bacterial phospho-glucose isomerase C-terminal SIS domain